MIISHKHRFIFLKTRKTAGTSIEIALSQICGKDDIITPINEVDEIIRREFGGRGPQNFDIPYSRYEIKDWLRLILRGRSRKFYNHMNARMIRAYVGGDIWNSYYKFCFDRNPYDKCVSHYYWRGGKNSYGSFLKYVESADIHRAINIDMYTINDQVVVDRVYLFEDLTASLADLRCRLGLSVQLDLPKTKAKGGSRKDKDHYSKNYNETSKSVVETVFSHEIELLNYKFEEEL